jgi:hypothetical protein
VFRGGILCTEMKINRNFNEFTDFESLELKVPTFCFVTGCVSARRDRRYPCVPKKPVVPKKFIGTST